MSCKQRKQASYKNIPKSPLLSDEMMRAEPATSRQAPVLGGAGRRRRGPAFPLRCCCRTDVTTASELRQKKPVS